MIRTLLMVLNFAAPAGAQSDGLVGRPCEILPDLKGTCFHAANGDIVYWLVRQWNPVEDGGGPMYGAKEFTGYPALLKRQQEYNRWVETVNPKNMPGFEFDANEKALNGLLNESRKRQWEEERQQRLAGREVAADRYTCIPGLYPTQLTIKYGWKEIVDGIIAPKHITENGAISPLTLRIPLFMAGARIFAVRHHLKEDWQRNNYASFHKERTALLKSVDELTRRYDRIVTELKQDDNNNPIAATELPEGFTDRLTLIQTAIDDALNAEASIGETAARNLDALHAEQARKRAADDKATEERLQKWLEDLQKK